MNNIKKELEYLNKYLEKEKLEEGIRRLKNGEPVQYIVAMLIFMVLILM